MDPVTHIVVREGQTFQVAVPVAVQAAGEEAVAEYLEDAIAAQRANAAPPAAPVEE